MAAPQMADSDGRSGSKSAECAVPRYNSTTYYYYITLYAFDYI